MEHSSAIERFAAECGLSLSAEELYCAPRDVLHPPSESDRQFLVTVRRGATATVVRLVFLTQLADSEPPGVRDIRWWLAGDAWAVERAGRGLDAWAADHGYAREDAATARLFHCHRRQTTALQKLVGDVAYRQLLDLYSAEVSPRRPRAGQS